MRPRACLALLVLALAVLFAHDVAGTPRHWKKPALGRSHSGDPEVLFTFDDGPDRTLTPVVLATLRAHHVKAIFFMVGLHFFGQRALRYDPTIVKRVVADGHAIGNHTLHHAHMCLSSKDEMALQIDAMERILEKETGLERITFFRTPYGARCERLEEILEERHLRHLHWDIDPQDWQHHDKHRTALDIIDRLKRLRGRAVILLHDTKPSSAFALGEILDWIELENAHRIARGDRPIRILSPSDIASEWLSPHLPALMDDAAAATERLGPGVLGQVLLPLTGRVWTHTAQL